MDCRSLGHDYRFTTSDNARRCQRCKKVQVKYNGVWLDQKKQVNTRPKPVDANQLSLLEESIEESLTK